MSRLRTPKGWIDEGPRPADPFADSNLFDRRDTSRRQPAFMAPIARMAMGSAQRRTPVLSDAAMA